MGRQESVFLAESSASTSVEDQENSGNSKAFNQRFVFGSCETIQSESVAESEILTEEGDYSDEFESAGSSEGEFSKKVGKEDTVALPTKFVQSPWQTGHWHNF